MALNHQISKFEINYFRRIRELDSRSTNALREQEINIQLIQNNKCFFQQIQIFSQKILKIYVEIYQGINDNTTIVTFSIKFYYTKEFAESTDDIELYMDQVIKL